MSLFDSVNRPTKGVAVDVGCKGNPGPIEYRGIDLATGEEVFYFSFSGDSTNNIGEYLAAVHGLVYCADKGLDVYSDSKTAISWIRKKFVKTSFTLEDPIQIRAMERAALFLKTNNTQVKFWSNIEWGETPADLSGRKGVAKRK